MAGVETAEFVGCEEFSSVLADAAAPGAVHAFGFAGFDDVDGLVAEPVADGFGGGCLVASEEEPAVAVAGDGFPVVFIQAFALGDGLQDDRAADATRADGGDESHEVRDFADVGELVEQAVHIAAEPATIRVVGFPDQSLEEALVEHAGQEAERRVGVGQFQIDHALAFIQSLQVDVVAGEDAAHLAHLQGREVDAGGDDDAFLGFSGAFEERVVLGAGERQAFEHVASLLVVVVLVGAHGGDFDAGFGEEGIDDELALLVLFAGSHLVEHVGDVVERGFVLGVVDPCDQGGQQRFLGVFPEAVAVFAVAGGVGHEVVGQAQNRRLGFGRVDVAHGVEPVGTCEVHEVERVHRVAARLHRRFGVSFEFALGVGDGPVHVRAQEIGFDVVAGLAGAGRAEQQHVEVAQGTPRVGGEPFGAREP